MLSLVDATGRRTAACALRNCLYLFPLGALATWLGVTSPYFAYESGGGAQPGLSRYLLACLAVLCCRSVGLALLAGSATAAGTPVTAQPLPSPLPSRLPSFPRVQPSSPLA